MTRTISRNGVEFNVVNDTPNAGFWNHSDWEKDNYILLKEQAEKHDTIVQAGGWIGAFTLYCGKLYKNVYCLEPDPVAREELSRNIAVNDLKNIHLGDMAFYNIKTSVLLGSDFSPLGQSGTSVMQSANSFTAETTTLMDFYSSNKLPKRTMLMLDIEGVECLMFEDKKFFKKYLPTINMSFHLPFLTDHQFDHMISGMEKIKDIYNIDIEFFKNKRKDNLYRQHYIDGIPSFAEFSYLFELL